MKPRKKASRAGVLGSEQGEGQGPLSVLGFVSVCGEPLEESWVLEDESRSEEGTRGGPSYGQARIMTKPREAVCGWGRCERRGRRKGSPITVSG